MKRWSSWSSSLLLCVYGRWRGILGRLEGEGGEDKQEALYNLPICSAVMGTAGKDLTASLEAGGAWIRSNAALLKRNDAIIRNWQK